MIELTLIRPNDCEHCADVKELLEKLSKDYSDLLIEEIDAATEKGQQLIIEHGIMQSPGILVNGKFFAMGNVSEAELRSKLNKLK
jgi:glutaredoxin